MDTTNNGTRSLADEGFGAFCRKCADIDIEDRGFCAACCELRTDEDYRDDFVPVGEPCDCCEDSRLTYEDAHAVTYNGRTQVVCSDCLESEDGVTLGDCDRCGERVDLVLGVTECSESCKGPRCLDDGPAPSSVDVRCDGGCGLLVFGMDACPECEGQEVANG
jgi:hypothetical protein